VAGAALVVCALILFRIAPIANAAAPPSIPAYTKTGELVMPADYRTWTFLTSNINMGYPSEGPRPANGPVTFGNVFVNPDAYRAFMKTGTWPDKTMLMIEVRGSGHTAAINEDARFQTDIQRFEFHVKDQAHGGWTFYLVRAGAASGTPFAKTESCYTCHEQHAAVDTTFVQYYPPLIDIARQKGTYKEKPE
jgi:hypothetical protein